MGPPPPTVHGRCCIPRQHSARGQTESREHSGKECERAFCTCGAHPASRTVGAIFYQFILTLKHQLAKEACSPPGAQASSASSFLSGWRAWLFIPHAWL